MFLASERDFVIFHLAGALVGILLFLTQLNKEGPTLGVSLP